MRLIALFTVLVLSALSQQTPVFIHNGFLKAEEYVHMGAQRQRDYAMGVTDGMMLAPLFGAPPDGPIKTFVACLVDMTDTQVSAIISKFIQDHPERWNESLHATAFAALTEACSRK